MEDEFVPYTEVGRDPQPQAPRQRAAQHPPRFEEDTQGRAMPFDPRPTATPPIALQDNRQRAKELMKFAGWLANIIERECRPEEYCRLQRMVELHLGVQ